MKTGFTSRSRTYCLQIIKFEFLEMLVIFILNTQFIILSTMLTDMWKHVPTGLSPRVEQWIYKNAYSNLTMNCGILNMHGIRTEIWNRMSGLVLLLAWKVREWELKGKEKSVTWQFFSWSFWSTCYFWIHCLRDRNCLK